MRAPGQMWDAGLIIDSSARGLTWLQRLRQRWFAYRAQHKQVRLIRQGVGWHARRELIRTSPSLSALEYAAGQGGPAMAMTLYSAHTDMACTG